MKRLRFKVNEIVMVEYLRDINTGKIHEMLIGEIRGIERSKYLIYFESLNSCVYLDREFVDKVTKAHKILYG